MDAAGAAPDTERYPAWSQGPERDGEEDRDGEGREWRDIMEEGFDRGTVHGEEGQSLAMEWSGRSMEAGGT
jgi:hypothetical protein